VAGRRGHEQVSPAPLTTTVARALELVISGLSLGGVYALLAFAMSLTISTTRVLNVAHGVFFVWGGAAFVVLSQRLALYPALTLVILTALFFVFGLLFQWGIVRPLLGRSVHLLLVGSIMATFGLALSMESALGYAWVTFVDPYPVFSSSLAMFPVHLGPVSLSGSRLVILAFVLVAVTGFHLFLQKTFLGKGARAMAQNFDGFLVIGLNPYRLSLILFTLAIVATAISGAFYVLAVPLNPYDGLPLTLKSFTVVILAGVGNLPATLVAGALLGLAEVMTSQFLGTVWAPAVSLAILFLVLVFKPTGLFGKGVY
jgi:branched-chain amino acid transport system permease protein